MPNSAKLFGPKISLLAVILLDAAVLAASASLVIGLRHAFGGDFSPQLYVNLSWTILLFVCIAMSLGLYPGYLRTPPEELKLMSWATSLFFLMVSSLTFLSRGAELYSRLIFLSSWLLALLSLPLARMAARQYLGRHFAWGYPCVVVGGRDEALCALQSIRNETPRLWPLAVVTVGDRPMPGEEPIPVVPFKELPRIAASHPHCHAILVYSPTSEFPEPETVERLSCHFKHILISSPKISQLSLWARGVDVGGETCLKTYFKLLDPARQRIKSLFDLVLCMLGCFVAFPAMLIIAAWIKLDSPGPVLFRQTRVGRGGKTFEIFKFRTMRCDAEACLAGYLTEGAQLAMEWKDAQKIENDPRITRVGRFLRATSLDELPQFINVIGGSMSLVGPRPIVDDEIKRYGKKFEIYTRLKPGITGLWQVSGRNRLSYERRVEIDVYYVRNWSIWLDIWILLRTIPEVVSCNGK